MIEYKYARERIVRGMRTEMKRELDHFYIGRSYGGNQDWFRTFMMRLGGCAAGYGAGQSRDLQRIPVAGFEGAVGYRAHAEGRVCPVSPGMTDAGVYIFTKGATNRLLFY